MNFIIKPYDPLDEAIQLFKEFNENVEERQWTETELTNLIVHRVKQHDSRQSGDDWDEDAGARQPLPVVA